jgi:DinB family protein
MATRDEIHAALERALAELEADARALTREQLEQRCTDSEVPGGAPWSPKDHIAHLIRIERSFLTFARRTVDGDVEPIGFSRMGGNQDEVRAAIHLANQRQVEDLASRSLDDLFAELRAARADTLAFIDGHDDDTLARPVPGSPWGDGTIGGMLGRNAAHQLNHMHAYREGLAARC